MENGEKRTLQDLLEDENNTGQKIVNSVKSNAYFIIAALISIVFVGFGLLKIDPRKNPYEIIAASIIGLIVGWVIKTLLGKQGINAGLSSKKYQREQDAYDKLVLDNNKDSEHYIVFCELENELRIKTYRTQLLATCNLKYENFVNGDYDNLKNYINAKGERIELSKKQIKVLNKVINPKVNFITPDYLTNESSVSSISDKAETSTKLYESKRGGTTLVSALVITSIFAFYGVGFASDINFATIIWNTLQVLIYIAMGFTEYFRSYRWVVTEKYSYLRKRCSYLIKFKNLIENKQSILWNRINELDKGENINGK